MTLDKGAEQVAIVARAATISNCGRYRYSHDRAVVQIEYLRAVARAVGLSDDDIARAESRARTEPHTTTERALRAAIDRKAQGVDGLPRDGREVPRQR